METKVELTFSLFLRTNLQIELLGECGMIETLFAVMKIDENRLLIPLVAKRLSRSKLVTSEVSFIALLYR
jgi:hypothetical protein